MLHNDRENFEQIILKVSDATGIEAILIYNVYYVIFLQILLFKRVLLRKMSKLISKQISKQISGINQLFVEKLV